MDARIESRWRLWLRSERAFGLSLVRVGGQAVPSPDESLSETAAEEDDLNPSAVAASGLSTITESGPKTPAFSLFGETPSAIPDASPAAVPTIESPPMAPDEKRAYLAAMERDEVRNCTLCRLCETRKKTVFGEGDADAKIFFVGEGPGANEDASGRPFVGRAGELLDKMIAGMGLQRERVFIANIVKCRPPGNREPAPDEVATCTPYLVRQLETVRPQVIVTLGRPASQYLLQSKLSMSRLRGQWQQWRGIKVMPTYHPAYVLREYERGEAAKRQVRAAVWSDLQKVMAEVGLPARGG